MKRYLQKFSNVSDEFIEDFADIVTRTYDDTENETAMLIDLDKIIKCLKIRKDNLKRLLIKNFCKNTDYNITKLKKHHKMGYSYFDKIFVTPRCFKKICIMSPNPNAKKVITYYESLEELIKKYHASAIDENVSIIDDEVDTVDNEVGMTDDAVDVIDDILPIKPKKHSVNVIKSNKCSVKNAIADNISVLDDIPVTNDDVSDNELDDDDLLNIKFTKHSTGIIKSNKNPIEITNNLSNMFNFDKYTTRLLFYILSSEIDANDNVYKIGYVTGTTDTLISRYSTYLHYRHPIIYYCEYRNDAKDVERYLKKVLIDNRILNKRTNKTEWVNYKLDDILKTLNEYDNDNDHIGTIIIDTQNNIDISNEYRAYMKQLNKNFDYN